MNRIIKIGMDVHSTNYDDYSIECGYEAGCLGYTLYHQLTNARLKCVILAPTIMLTQQGQRTDSRRKR